MFLPRTYQQTDTMECQPGHICATHAVIGSESYENNDGLWGPPDFEKPGPHRYIGIGMVAGMILIVLLFWLAFGRWPQRMTKAYCCFHRKARTREEGIVRLCQMDLAEGRGSQGEKSSLQTEWTETTTGHKAGAKFEDIADWKVPDVPRRVHYEV